MRFVLKIMEHPEFMLTAKQALSRDILDCCLRTLNTLKKEGKLIKGTHYINHFGKGHRYSEKALLKFRRDNERKTA